MKPTQRLDAIRNIRRRIVSFLSIAVIVTMGVSGLLCIFFTGQSMDRYAMEFYQTTNFKDLDLISTLGISDENLDRVRQVDGVEDAEGLYQADGRLVAGNQETSLTLISRTERISVPELKSGRMPETAEECALDFQVMEQLGLTIGDQVSLHVTQNGLGEILKSDSFTITGTMVHPDFLDMKASHAVLLAKDAFDPDVVSGGYLRAFVDLEVPDSVDFFRTKDYYKLTEPAETRLRELSAALAEERSSEISSKAWDQYNQAKSEADEKLQEAKTKLDNGEQELSEKTDEVRTKLDGGMEDLIENEWKFSDAVKRIEDGEQQYEAAIRQIEEARAQLTNARAQLDAGAWQYQQGLYTFNSSLNAQIDQLGTELPSDITSEITAAIESLPAMEKGQLALETLNDVLSNQEALEQEGLLDPQTEASLIEKRDTLASGLNSLYYASAQLSSGEAQYWQGVTTLNEQVEEADLPGKSAQIDDAWDQLKKGRKTLDESWLSYEQGKLEADVQIAQGKIELDNGKETYQTQKLEADKKLEEGREQIGELDPAHFIVANRKTNVSFVGLQTSVNAVNAFGGVFVPMFAIVGILVVFSTITIIIEEQQKQVGALKAQGLHRSEIRGKYLLFGVSATITGVVVGMCLGMLLEHTILKMIHKEYFLDRMRVVFVPWIAAIICGTTILVAVGVVWFSCRNLLKSSAIGLMNGSEPVKKTLKQSSRQHKSLYSHLVISNIVTDLPRVLVSIVVVVGSCMLIGFGLMMRDAFNSSLNRQADDINLYDFQIDMDNSSEHRNMERVEAILEKYGADYLPVIYRAALYDTENESAAFYILCAEPARLNTFVNISVEIPDSGILLPEKFLETRQLSSDQTMTIYDASLTPHTAKVSGSYPFYVGFYAVMSPESYEEIFGEAPVWNGYYCRADEKDIDQMKQEILQIAPDAGIESKDEFQDKYSSVQQLFNVVALIMLLISIVITFVIMINLTNILVNHRMKDLLIMKVNGYSYRKVIGYLLKETVLIDILGIVLGVCIGAVMNPMIIRGIESDNMMYVRSVSILAWSCAAGLTLLFNLVINAISFRKIRRIPLTDITKY